MTGMMDALPKHRQVADANIHGGGSILTEHPLQHVTITPREFEGCKVGG